MQVDFQFMKTSYACIKDATCDKCPTHTDQIVFGKSRPINNTIYFCPAPELKVEKVSGAWKKSKAMAK